MTPPGVWTSEAPAESGWYWWRSGGMNPIVLDLHKGRGQGPTVKHSVYAIPSAERLAAMERAVEALRMLQALVVGEAPHLLDGDRGGDERTDSLVRAALAAVEAAK